MSIDTTSTATATQAATPAVPTRRLLACGIAAGPLFAAPGLSLRIADGALVAFAHTTLLATHLNRTVR